MCVVITSILNANLHHLGCNFQDRWNDNTHNKPSKAFTLEFFHCDFEARNHFPKLSLVALENVWGVPRRTFSGLGSRTLCSPVVFFFHHSSGGVADQRSPQRNAPSSNLLANLAGIPTEKCFLEDFKVVATSFNLCANSILGRKQFFCVPYDAPLAGAPTSRCTIIFGSHKKENGRWLSFSTCIPVSQLAVRREQVASAFI